MIVCILGGVRVGSLRHANPIFHTYIPHSPVSCDFPGRRWAMIFGHCTPSLPHPSGVGRRPDFFQQPPLSETDHFLYTRV